MTEQNKQPVKSLQFYITNRCNYKCEYCCQGRGTGETNYVEFEHASDEVIDAFLKLVDSLDDSYNISFTGGEVMLHPRFAEIVEKIGNTNHEITFLTNLSFPLETYQNIVDRSNNSLIQIGASMHLSQVKSLDDFIDKAIALNKYIIANNKKMDLYINLVLTEKNYETAKNIAEKLKTHDIRLNLQNLKINGDFVNYSPKAKELFDDYNNGENISKIKDFKSYGTVCCTGYCFYNIYYTGDVTRCYNHQGHYTTLGNIAKGTFKPFDRPHPCYSQKCTCVTPANRNLIRFGEYDWDMIREFEEQEEKLRKSLKRRLDCGARRMANHFPLLKHFIKKVMKS